MSENVQTHFDQRDPNAPLIDGALLESEIEHEATQFLARMTAMDFCDFVYEAAPAILDAVRFGRPDVAGKIVCDVLENVAHRIGTREVRGEAAAADMQDDEAIAKAILLAMIPEASNAR